MAKIIEATCQAGIVTADDLPVPVATILSKGVGASEGALAMDGEKAYYIASSAEDIKDVLISIDGILAQLLTILTGLDAGTVTPGTQAAAIVILQTLKTQLATKKDILR